MSRLRDNLSVLEYRLDDLAKRPRDAGTLHERRLTLRKAFEEWGNERYQEGYTEGMCDVGDAEYASKSSTEEEQADG